MKSNSASTPNKASKNKTDLPDSKKDQKQMKSEDIVMDMPEVKDIPGRKTLKFRA
jgi:hypothetical protein